MLAKFAEDDKIEQMNAQKRRMKQLEHKHAVEELLQERRRQFAADRERELAARKEEEEMEAFKKRIIEEERMRLLREHAGNLAGYLPKVRCRIRLDVEVEAEINMKSVMDEIAIKIVWFNLDFIKWC